MINKLLLTGIGAIMISVTIAQPLGVLGNNVSSTCPGSSTSISAIASGGDGGPYTYLWMPGGLSGSMVNVAPTSSTTYTVTATDGSSNSGTTTITVNVPSPISVFVSPTDTICIGQTSSIYAMATGGTPGYSYSWSPSVGTGGGPFNVNPTSTTYYHVIAVDANGCLSAMQTATVFVFPAISLTTNSLPVCSGKPAFISATTSGGTGGPYTYSWSNGVTSSSQLIIPAISSGTVTYTVSVNDGCSAVVNAIAYVTVMPNPIADFSTSIAVNTVSFTNLSSPGSYMGGWNFGDGNSSTIENPVHTYASAGSYNVLLKRVTPTGCLDSISQTIIVTGINEFYLNPSVTISPNPFNTSAILELKGKKNNFKNTYFLLFDLLGKEMRKIEITSNNIVIEKENLSRGVYLYKVINENEIFATGKLTIE